MINFYPATFLDTIKLFQTHEKQAKDKSVLCKSLEQGHKLHYVDIDTKNELLDILRLSYAFSIQLNSYHIISQLENANARLGSTVLVWEELESYLRSLRETIETELRHHFFYHYPFDKGKKVVAFERDWQAVLMRFADVKKDAFSATDCYALGHDNASIYHSMMVLEFGLPALAKRLKVQFKADKASWGSLIGHIRTKIDSDLKALAHPQKGSRPIDRVAAKRKGEFLAKCQEAAMQFGYFKDTWRNHIAHGRANYDENDALKALNHVRDFMEILATKLKLGRP